MYLLAPNNGDYKGWSKENKAAIHQLTLSRAPLVEANLHSKQDVVGDMNVAAKRSPLIWRRLAIVVGVAEQWMGCCD